MADKPSTLLEKETGNWDGSSSRRKPPPNDQATNQTAQAAPNARGIMAEWDNVAWLITKIPIRPPKIRAIFWSTHWPLMLTPIAIKQSVTRTAQLKIEMATSMSRVNVSCSEIFVQSMTSNCKSVDSIPFSSLTNNWR